MEYVDGVKISEMASELSMSQEEQRAAVVALIEAFSLFMCVLWSLAPCAPHWPSAS